MTKVKSISIDTLTSIQQDEYAAHGRRQMLDRVKWKDWGLDIYNVVAELKSKGFRCVLVVGLPGSGKSMAYRNLPQDSHILYNADNKDVTWKGGRKQFGTLSDPTEFHVLPNTYQEIIDHIDAVKEADGFDNDPIAFVIGHLEDYKTKDGQMNQRLFTLGNLSNKMNIESSFTEVLYSEIIFNTEGEREYVFRTVGNPTDTCRASHELFDSEHIPNDYQLVIEAIENY